MVAISINVSRIIAYGVLPGQAVHALVVITGHLDHNQLRPVSRSDAQDLRAGGAGCWHHRVGCRRRVSLVEAAGPEKRCKPTFRLLTTLMTLLLTGVPLLVGGVLLVRGMDAGLYWVAVAVILSFVVRLLNGWVLLIEILR